MTIKWWVTFYTYSHPLLVMSLKRKQMEPYSAVCGGGKKFGHNQTYHVVNNEIRVTSPCVKGDCHCTVYSNRIPSKPPPGKSLWLTVNKYNFFMHSMLPLWFLCYVLVKFSKQCFLEFWFTILSVNFTTHPQYTSWIIIQIWVICWRWWFERFISAEFRRSGDNERLL